MRRIYAILANELHLLFRRGAGWGVVAITSATAIFMFLFARSDGILLNELQIRIRYSLYFSSGLLSLILMYIACISLRKEIDSRRFHTIAAAPVHRSQIWLGKFGGLLLFGLVSFTALSVSIAICCTVLIANWKNPQERNQLATSFYRSYALIKPERPTLLDLTEREFKRRQIAGLLPTDKPESVLRQEIHDSIRRSEQILEPGGTKHWQFPWIEHPPQGKSVILRTKFYTEDHKVKVEGTWTVRAVGKPGQWTFDFSGYAYQFHEIHIPASELPGCSSLEISFQGKNTPSLIFPLSNGVALLRDNGGIFGNFLRLLLCQFCYFASLLALSLTLCSFFSYSVAIFVNIVFYSIGSLSGFFTNVLRDINLEAGNGETGLLLPLFKGLIHAGLWLTQGLKAPPVIDRFSEGLAIPLGELATTWGLGFFIYTLTVSIIGMVVLTRKEIDKELFN